MRYECEAQYKWEKLDYETGKEKYNMEKHLRDVLIALKAAQDEILFPCELYSQLEDMQFAIEAMIDGKTWERTAV